MSSLAPIALFVYNRPDHTQRTINFLKQNILANDSMLYIFSDGPKTASDINLVNEVRVIIQATTGFKSVQIITRDTNYGLADSIIDGVSSIISQHGKIIVFEDDLISSAHTLQYFNDALDKYQNETRVMHIGAYMYPIKTDQLPETFFYRAASSWGWATWARAWNYFEPDINKLINQFDDKQIRAFSIDGKMNFWKQMKELQKKKNNSWAIRWYASIFLNGGLTLNPGKSLINNIGHDGTGVHSGNHNLYENTISIKRVITFPEKIEENEQAYLAIKHFLAHRKGTLLQRGIRFLKQKIN